MSAWVPRLAEGLVDVSFQLVVVGGAILISYGLLARRASAAVRHDLVVAGLLVAVGLAGLHGRMPRFLPWMGGDAASGPTLSINRPVAETRSATRAEAVQTPAPAPATSSVALEAAVAPVGEPPTPLDWRPVVCLVWGLGVGVVAGRQLMGALFVRRLARSAKDWTRPGLDWPALARDCGLRRVPGLLVTDALASPAVAGVRSPVVLVPEPLAQGLEPDLLKPLLIHELSHLRRKDHVVNAFSLTMRALLWHHPFSWIAHRLLARQREIATDGDVVRHTRRRSPYVEGLLTVLRQQDANPSVPALGASRGSVAQRLDLLLGDDAGPWKPVSGRMRGLLGGLAAAMLLLASTTGVFAQDPGGASSASPRPVSAMKSLQRGLAYLAKAQRADGGWASASGKPGDEVAVTSLALLAFLGEGNVPGTGPRGENVERGLKWLRARQAEGGRIGTGPERPGFPAHALGTLALAEAWGLTRDSELAGPVERATKRLLRAQRQDGGWSVAADGPSQATTTSWALMALKGVQLGGGTVAKAALERAGAFLDGLTDPATGRVGDTATGALPPRSGEVAKAHPPEFTEGPTAAALLARIFTGRHPKTSEPLERGATLVAARRPVPTARGDAGVSPLYWYWGTLAMFQVGGRSWRGWNGSMKAAVAGRQRADGSWPATGPWVSALGPSAATALNAMGLEVSYRYARVFGSGR